MELNKNKFALAAACTAGLAYLVCAVFVFLWPAFAMRLVGWMMHIVDVNKLAATVELTAVGVVLGLVQVVVYGYVSVWVFAALHNKFVRSK